MIHGSDKANALDTSEGKGVVPRIAETVFLDSGDDKDGFYYSLHNEDGSEKPLLNVINKSTNSESIKEDMYNNYVKTVLDGKLEPTQIKISEEAISELYKTESDCWENVTKQTIAGSALGPLGTIAGYASSDIYKVGFTGNNGYKEEGGWHLYESNDEIKDGKKVFNIHMDIYDVTTKNPVVIYEHITEEYIQIKKDNDWMQTPSNNKIIQNYDWMTP